MASPHFGQWEPGNTTDSSSGQRSVQTFRNEPIINPTKPARAETIQASDKTSIKAIHSRG
jgi:hypothetical protein